jgi:hypothetical protein
MRADYWELCHQIDLSDKVPASFCSAVTFPSRGNMNPELFHLIADQRDPISGQGKYHT